MTARLKARDIGGEGRQWQLLYSIFDLPSIRNDYSDSNNPQSPTPSLHRCIIFRAKNDENDEEAKAITLKLLKKAVAGIRNTRRLFVAAVFPIDPRPGESLPLTEDIISLKRGWNNKRLLRIKDPNKVLVQGFRDTGQRPCAL
jgi:hypothetical protein